MAVVLRKTRQEALVEELRLFSPFAERIDNEAALNDGFRRARLAALCLSGGGIRSAAFCLGVIQVLAEQGLLKQFHYLSTVSGGGYIGTWLQALIRRCRGNRIASVEEAIAHSNGTPDPVRFLRNYTSYLSPETGLLSADIWADIVLWMRNTLLTWACCAPLILIPVVLALVYRTALWAFTDSILQKLLPLLGVLCLFSATVYGVMFLPKREGKRGRSRLLTSLLEIIHKKNGHLSIRALSILLYRRTTEYVAPADIAFRAVLPSVCWAFLAPFAVSGTDDPLRAGLLVPWYAAAVLLAYVVAGLCQWRLWNVYLSNFFRAWVWATLVSSLAVWGGLALATRVGVRDQAQALAVFGPLWLLATSGLHTIVFVALVSDGRLADLDREWLARLSALKLKWGTLWTLIAGPCLLLSWLFDQYTSGPAAWSWLLTLASGPTAAWLGKQAYAKIETIEKSKGQRALGLGLDALSALFLLGLLALAGYAIDKWWSGAVLQDRVIRGLLLASEPVRESARGAWLLTEHGKIYLDYVIGGPILHEGLPPYITFELSAWVPFCALLVTLIMLSGIFWALWRMVNVNRFSMHAVYRNRLYQPA